MKSLAIFSQVFLLIGKKLEYFYSWKYSSSDLTDSTETYIQKNFLDERPEKKIFSSKLVFLHFNSKEKWFHLIFVSYCIYLSFSKAFPPFSIVIHLSKRAGKFKSFPFV